MNIVLSAGHGLDDPGTVQPCVYPAKGEHIEHVLAYGVTWKLRDVLKANGHNVEFLSCFQILRSKVQAVNSIHAVTPVHWALEIHFNAFTNPSANGTEVLHYGLRTRDRAETISATLSKAIGTYDRGPQERKDLGWLKQTLCPALIVEVLFLSNPRDCSILEIADFAGVAAKGIAAGLEAPRRSHGD